MRWLEGARQVTGSAAMIGALGSATSCGLIAGVGDFTDADPGETVTSSTVTTGGGDGGQGGHGGKGGEGGSGGAASGNVIYVSPFGDDTNNDGWSKGAPKRSITAALQVARGSPEVGEIRVCQGPYPEGDLHLDIPISLLGGYDCVTWMRPADFAKPDYGGVKNTVIQGAGSSTVVVDAVTGDIRVEGFTIEAQPNAGNALRLQGAATIVIANNRIRAANGTTIAAPAMYIEGTDTDVNLTAEVTLNEIHGGSSSLVRTHGLYATNGGVLDIHHNAIHGGAGVCSGYCSGSTGAQLHHVSAGSSVWNNEIDGGSGQGSNAAYDSSALVIGLHELCSVDVEANVIRGGAKCTGALGCYGVRVAGAGGVALRRNRILGGVGPGKGTGLGAALMHQPLTVVANLIQGISPAAQAPNAGLAVNLQDSSGVVLQLNTLSAGSTEPVSHAFRQTADVSGTRLDGNLFLGLGYVLAIEGCGDLVPKPIDSFRSNAILFDVMSVTKDENCTGDALHSNITELTTELQNTYFAAADGNVSVRGSCGGEFNCFTDAACTTAGACAATILESFDAPSGGATTLMADGWKLGAGAPCAITGMPGLDMLSQAPEGNIDFFETMRMPAWSAGAHEYDGPCGQP